MNRIDQMFAAKLGKVLSIYTTAGYPSMEDTPAILRALQEHGADMVEIGMPFSDPLADGPVIQESSQVALANGMTVKRLFGQLQDIRRSVQLPLVLMGYLNPVLSYGMEPFLASCMEVGIDGVIIPDLPPEIFEVSYRELFKRYGVHHAMLITPHTPEERIRKIAGISGGFLYLVAEASTTGARSSVQAHQLEYFRRIEKMGLPLPCLVGFGISSHETFTLACRHTRGAIIGSAFIRMLSSEGAGANQIGRFLKGIREA